MFMLQDDFENRPQYFRSQLFVRDKFLADKTHKHGAAGDPKPQNAFRTFTDRLAQDFHHIVAARLEQLDAIPRCSVDGRDKDGRGKNTSA